MSNSTLLVKPVRHSATSVVEKPKGKKVVNTTPAPEPKQEEPIVLKQEDTGYVHGARPSDASLRLEADVELALRELGATTPNFLEWTIEEFIRFIKEEVDYYKSPPRGSEWPNIGHMLVESTLKNMGKSHPHIKCWEQLSVKEAIDFLLGVDVAVMYKGGFYAFDITANPEAVSSKMEKACFAFKGARFDILQALGCHYYVVVLGEFYKDIGTKELREKLSDLGEDMVTAISLIKEKKVIQVTLSGLMEV